eukprot:gene2625-3822_t
MNQENFLNFVKEDLLNEDESSQDFESQIDSYIQILNISECFHHNLQDNCKECQSLNSNGVESNKLIQNFKKVTLEDISKTKDKERNMNDEIILQNEIKQQMNDSSQIELEIKVLVSSCNVDILEFGFDHQYNNHYYYILDSKLSPFNVKNIIEETLKIKSLPLETSFLSEDILNHSNYELEEELDNSISEMYSIINSTEIYYHLSITNELLRNRNELNESIIFEEIESFNHSNKEKDDQCFFMHPRNIIVQVEEEEEIDLKKKKRKRKDEILNCLILIKKLKDNFNNYKYHINEIIFENREIESTISFDEIKNEMNEINLFSEESKEMIIEQDENECGICLLELYDNTEIYSLDSCKHCFHLNCISKCIDSRNIKNRCVKCFKSIKNDEIKHIKKLNSFQIRNSRLLKREKK